MNNFIMPFLAQLLAQAPVLLVYLAGLVLALVFWRRWPAPCLLVLLGSLLLLLLAVVQPLMTHYLIQARSETGWSHAKFGWMLSAIGLTSSWLRAAALGLILAAVFVQRRVPPPLGPNVSGERTAAAPEIS